MFLRSSTWILESIQPVAQMGSASTHRESRAHVLALMKSGETTSGDAEDPAHHLDSRARLAWRLALALSVLRSSPGYVYGPRDGFVQKVPVERRGQIRRKQMSSKKQRDRRIRRKRQERPLGHPHAPFSS